ncbi:MAG: energy transducer TonB [Bacteroidota bacterium]
MSDRAGQRGQTLIACAVVALLVLAACQPLRKVQVVSNAPAFREVYFETKGNDPVRQGRYEKTGPDGKPWDEGYYRNGLRDSTWVERAYPGATLRGEGTYQNNQRTGTWTFYSTLNEVEQVYNYATQQWETLVTATERDWQVSTDGRTFFKARVDQGPAMVGGEAALMRVIASNLKKEPSTAVRFVITEFTVTPQGEVIEPVILKGVCPSCDSEVMRVLQLLPDGWSPAVFQGEPVYAKYRVPIRF